MASPNHTPERAEPEPGEIRRRVIRLEAKLDALSTRSRQTQQWVRNLALSIIGLMAAVVGAGATLIVSL